MELRPQDLDAWNECLKAGEKVVRKEGLAGAAYHPAYQTLICWLRRNEGREELNELEVLAFESIETLELFQTVHRRVMTSSKVRALVADRYFYIIYQNCRKLSMFDFKQILNTINSCHHACTTILDTTLDPTPLRLGSVCIYVEIILENFLIEILKGLQGHSFNYSQDGPNRLQHDIELRMIEIVYLLRYSTMPLEDDDKFEEIGKLVEKGLAGSEHAEKVQT